MEGPDGRGLNVLTPVQNVMNKPIKNSFVSVFDKHLCHLFSEG